MKVSYLLVCSIVLISTIVIGGCSSEKSSFVLTCKGIVTFITFGVTDDTEKVYDERYTLINKSFLGLFNDWELGEGEFGNNRNYLNQQLHLNDYDVSESVDVTKDYISVVSSYHRLGIEKNNKNNSDTHETIMINRGSGEWKYHYLYIETDKNNKITFNNEIKELGSCDRLNNKI
jgi:hypothetical protein